MLSSRLFWKLFGAYAGLSLLTAIAFATLVTRWGALHIVAQIEHRLEDSAALVGAAVAGQLPEAEAGGAIQERILPLARQIEARITVVDRGGRVLADSEQDPARMENHALRPEFFAARSEGQGSSQRYSRTVGYPMLYVARRIDVGDRPLGMVRVAVPLESVEREVGRQRNLVLGLAAAVTLVALALTYAIVARIVRPLARLTEAAQAVSQGDYAQRVVVRGRDEFADLAAAFTQMSGELARRIGQLEGRRQELATVLGSMFEGVVALNERREVLFANRAALDLLDLPTDRVEGRPLWELFRRPEIDAVVETVASGGKPQSVELDEVGRRRRRLSLNVVNLPGEPPQGMVLVFHDVTELRRLERMRQDFVANVSHELKTPLSSIAAYTETLLDGALEDPTHNRHFVTRIRRQAQRLEQLILDMLSLASIESGEQPLKIEPVPLAPTIAESLREHGPTAEARRVRLETDPPDTPLSARADREALRQILDNLLDNAVKYTAEGGLVRVRWRPEEESVVLEVEDDGIGIPPAEQQRIFERFYRVDKARSRELGGTGLGLAIVKHLCQALGGAVGVESRPGHGSRFWVRLPASS